MKTTFKTLAVAAALGFAAGPGLAAEKVNIGVPSWTGAQAIAHLLKEVVESRIGGEAGLVPGAHETIAIRTQNEAPVMGQVGLARRF